MDGSTILTNTRGDGMAYTKTRPHQEDRHERTATHRRILSFPHRPVRSARQRLNPALPGPAQSQPPATPSRITSSPRPLFFKKTTNPPPTNSARRSTEVSIRAGLKSGHTWVSRKFSTPAASTNAPPTSCARPCEPATTPEARRMSPRPALTEVARYEPLSEAKLL